ncbi:MAG: hypothetical protein JNL79_22605 [Myxococcales bacterium]|nr:hypothetical protein [Myxococcales bacterium]
MGSERGSSKGGSIPAAIVVGSLIIAFGLYKGLAARAPAPGPAVFVPTPPAPTGSTPPGPVTPQLLALDRQAAVDERTRNALEKERTTLLDRCWKPFVTDGGARQSLYKFEVWFDAAGKETRRDIFPVPNAEARPDTLKCLRAWETKLSIVVPTPASEVKAVVELPFP